MRAIVLSVAIFKEVWARGDASGMGEANAIETQLLDNGIDMSLDLSVYNTYNEINDVHDLHGEFSLSLRANFRGEVNKNQRLGLCV